VRLCKHAIERLGDDRGDIAADGDESGFHF
jgi:hypothetical protein